MRKNRVQRETQSRMAEEMEFWPRLSWPQVHKREPFRFCKSFCSPGIGGPGTISKDIPLSLMDSLKRQSLEISQIISLFFWKFPPQSQTASKFCFAAYWGAWGENWAPEVIATSRKAPPHQTSPLPAARHRVWVCRGSLSSASPDIGSHLCSLLNPFARGAVERAWMSSRKSLDSNFASATC